MISKIEILFLRFTQKKPCFFQTDSGNLPVNLRKAGNLPIGFLDTFILVVLIAKLKFLIIAHQRIVLTVS